MKGKKAREKLYDIFGKRLVFNKKFDDFFENLKIGMQYDLIHWCVQCKDELVLGSVPPKKGYRDMFVFFKKIGSQTRAILIKEQNFGFIELILSDHYSHDQKRKELGYKKSSYYGS